MTMVMTDLSGINSAAVDLAFLTRWLREEDPARLEALFAAADAVRLEHVGNAVHLRGLVEISNHCVRHCAYCGMRAPNKAIERYRMTADEILECAREALGHGFGTVVLQAGEDYGITSDWVEALIRRIKAETGLAVTLSLGERPERELAAWRRAGADRYLLRFETSDPDLYRRIHPILPGGPLDRLSHLRILAGLGYEAGGGVMIGIPGQSYTILARDILTFREMDLDMIGTGPYLPHPATPLGRGEIPSELPPREQVPNTELMAYKVIALARLACPQANIPATTALATVNSGAGYELGLARGANVVMPNLTPLHYRALYEIYPDKASLAVNASVERLMERIRSVGRTIGTGPGGREHG